MRFGTDAIEDGYAKCSRAEYNAFGG